MKDKKYFLRTDLDTYSKKFLLLCNECISEIPQKSLKETEKRDKVINIIEINK